MIRIENHLLVVGLLAGAVVIALAQSKQPAPPNFEVASVRLCESGVARVRGNVSTTPGRLQVTCLPLYNVASIAYSTDLRYPLKETGPGWIKSDAYNIEAKAEGNPSPQLMQGPMLQALLENRFSLKIRHETREVSVYVLTVAKNGSKLRALQPGSCTPFDPANPPAAGPGASKAAMAKICATANTIGLRGRPGGPVTADFHGITLDDFSRALDRAMDRTVINRTGIAGMFDVHMEFAPDDAVPGFIPGGKLLGFAGPPNPPLTADPIPGPSIFTAIQDQLGLKLENGKGSAEFFTIEHVERPTEN